MLFVCLWIFPCSLLDAWTGLYETWYVCHGSWAHLNCVLHRSLSSVHVSECVSQRIVARQLLGRHVPVATNTCNNRRIVGIVFYTVRLVSKDSLWVCLCVPLSLPWLLKHVPAAKKNYWRRRFLCCPYGIKGKKAISSSQNFLFNSSYNLVSYSLRYIVLWPLTPYSCNTQNLHLYLYS
jgi:hypothetical protein